MTRHSLGMTGPGMTSGLQKKAAQVRLPADLGLLMMVTEVIMRRQTVISLLFRKEAAITIVPGLKLQPGKALCPTCCGFTATSTTSTRLVSVH